jgi:excisionase family DNA binding protein
MRQHERNGAMNGMATAETATDVRQVGLVDVVQELRALRAAIARQDAELMTAAQAARFLGIGKTKLYQLAALDERLKPVKLPGGGKRWRRADLEAFVASLGD